MGRIPSVSIAVLGLMAAVVSRNLQATAPQEPTLGGSGSGVAAQRELLDRYCVACHSDRLRTGGLTLESVGIENVGARADVWEKVLSKLRTGAMPPVGRPRPAPAEAAPFVSWLESSLDNAAKHHPNPGRPPAHRLNRAEYGNAIRDLLALDVDVASLLPPDNSGAGFDNIAEVLSVSPSLLERYMTAARRISSLAVGDPAVRQAIYRVSRDLAQNERISEDLPLGSRGGVAIRHYFPVDGEYQIKVRLQRNLLDEVRGLADVNQVDLRIDDVRVKLFSVGGEEPEKGKEERVNAVHLAISAYLVHADDPLQVRVPVKAGSHPVGVTLVNRVTAPEGLPQPPLTPKSADVFHGRNTGLGVGQVEIRGPEKVVGPGDTPSRRRIFLCRPSGASAEEACARQILSVLARRAFRRPVNKAELQDLFGFFEAGRSKGGFDAGVEMALWRILVSPYFLFRVEEDPSGVAPNSPYRLTNLELASRLSFFLWSSIPDDQLLDLAIRQRLTDPVVLDQQVKRMLADPRCNALVTNFAGQWLYLRNMSFVTPNEESFPEFNENLRQDFRQETELFFESILREDRSVVDLLTANYTFLNERLARHYGIANVTGNRFRRVTLSDDQLMRMGVFGHGSILTVTSYATRTSPVLRGKWILDNILGSPPPPPPPNVPDLKDKSEDGKALSMRDAMEQHRKSPVCAGCHARMDPLGFALENFDAIGRWRTISESKGPIDASGAFPDGTTFRGPIELRQALLNRREEFVQTLTEKLLTYATGRGVDYFDMPAVRAIAHDAAQSDYRFSSLILGIIRSTPFEMRRSAERQTIPAVAAARK